MLRTWRVLGGKIESKISRRGTQGQFTRMVFGLEQFITGVVKSIQHQMLPARNVSQLSGKEGGECVGHWPRLRIPRNGCQVRMLRSGYNIEPSEAGAFQSFTSELAPFIINAIRHQCVVSVKFPEVSRPLMFSVGYECQRLWLQCQRIGLQDEISGLHDHHMKLAGGLLRIQGGRVG